MREITERDDVDTPAGRAPRPGRYLAIVGLAFATVCAAWLVLVTSQFSRHTNISYGLCKLVQAKQIIATRAGTEKVLFIAGSSGQGLDAARVHEATGINVVNFATHAALPPGVILHAAKDTLNPGDKAILAFEYAAYQRTGPTSRGIDFILGCGQDYFEQASLDTKLMTLFGMPPLRLIQPLIQSPEKYFEKNGRDENDFGPRGDLQANDFKRPDPERIAASGPVSLGINEQSSALREIADFVDWAKEREIEVFATWPNTIYFDAYENDPGFDDVRSFFSKLDVAMIGQPEDAMIPKDLFYNTNYHPNREGMTVRTDRFIDVLLETRPIGLRVDHRQPNLPAGTTASR